MKVCCVFVAMSLGVAGDSIRVRVIVVKSRLFVCFLVSVCDDGEYGVTECVGAC
jgi:hypothetical protein